MPNETFQIGHVKKLPTMQHLAGIPRLIMLFSYMFCAHCELWEIALLDTHKHALQEILADKYLNTYAAKCSRLC